MESTETKMKRIAQFVFDNAATIINQLSLSDNHRQVALSFNMFKVDGSQDMQMKLTIYDEKAHHYFLDGDTICIQRFRELWKQVNDKVGVNPPPKPVKVRKILQKKSWFKKKE